MNTLTRALAAGVVATATLVLVRQALWHLEPAALREREMRLREGTEQTGFQKPVRALAERLKVPLSKKGETALGELIAWSAGILGVVAYTFARTRWPRLGAGRGALFGVGVWLGEDEGAMPALGLAKGPSHYPWQAHARGFGAHLAYGVAAESTLRALER